eukprot:CAMPEP_0119567234 /NCGR_PEP_ID=MMETSP1352-20130426/35344_1 /TAXON_ID=265584 /ORGANISM="Stauroneis constricta, Strain CCMP1120" /LENGTH=442 /DNA_ID=CAMNT_0007616467 /DNA_START=291 /DNA_END=1619 /DNA_ORIENTATION=-
MRCIMFAAMTATATVMTASAFVPTPRIMHPAYVATPKQTHMPLPHLQRGVLVHGITAASSSTRRQLSSSDGNNSNNEEAAQRHNDARTDVRSFVTQRAIQSFMYLLTTVRDPHSVKWMEDFLDTKNQLNFHGTGAGYLERFGGTWDAPLRAMMNRPKDVVIVSAKRSGKGHKGWSKNNPYLEDRYVEFEIDIDPVSLTSRILSVREQISKEMHQDLDFLAEANDLILSSYFAIAKANREKSDMEMIQNPSHVAFERTAVSIMEQSAFNSAVASSPFRKGNFDLLYNLCTQASIHRVLRTLKAAGEDKEISYIWLSRFYTSRVADYFDGDLQYGMADDFMDELLRESPTVIYDDERKTGGLADPLGLAEQIIEERRDVVNEWKAIMANIPQDHTETIRKELLDKQMMAWSSPSSTGTTESAAAAETTTSTAETNQEVPIGEFE